MFGKVSFCVEVVIRSLSLILPLKEFVYLATFLSHEPQALWIFNNYSSSPNGLWVNSSWGRRPKISRHHLLFLFIVWIFHKRKVSSQQGNRASQSQRFTATLLLVSTTSILSWLPLVTANYIFKVQNITTLKRLLIYDIIYSQLFKLFCKFGSVLIKKEYLSSYKH